jgi:hypothetical protein
MHWLPVRPAPAHVTNRHAGAAWRCLLFCVLAAVCALPSAHALSPDRTLTQLRHDRWTPNEGAPAQIFSIAQTPDGLLWLGSRQGLFRFDGVRFERITTAGGKPLIDDDVLSLKAEADGSLWVGYFNGGMSRVGGPAPGQYAYERDDVPLGSVMGFARDARKRLWAITPVALGLVGCSQRHLDIRAGHGLQTGLATETDLRRPPGWALGGVRRKPGLRHRVPGARRYPIPAVSKARC